MKQSVFATAYLPSHTYLIACAASSSIIIDGNNLWQRQTARNRTYILTANGIECLSIPVIDSRKRSADKDKKISYSENWIRVHIRALISAYNQSPFFSMIADDLFAIIESKPVFLIDLNTKILEWLLKKSKITAVISPEFADGPELNDYRNLSDLKVYDEFRQSAPETNYLQVFSEKFPFYPGLSVIDTLSNTGGIR